MSLPVLLFWLSLPIIVAGGPRRMLPVLMFYYAFGTLNVVPSGGGLTLLPTAVLGAIFVASVFLRCLMAYRLSALVALRAEGLLLIYFLWGVMATCVFLPFFSGFVRIIPVNVSADPAIIPLAYSFQNVTQILYAFTSVGVVLSVAYLVRRKDFLPVILDGVLTLTVTLALTGLLDLVTQATGHATVLAPLRTANYGLLTADAIDGMKRVVGLFPEASAYGPPTVAIGAMTIYLRNQYPGRRIRLLALAGGILALVMGVLSLSSTAFLVFFLLAILASLQFLAGLIKARRVSFRRFFTGILSAYAIVGGIVLLILLEPSFRVHAAQLVTELVFQKDQSGSYQQRSLWNEVSLSAWLASNGLGIGFGSARCSSGLVAALVQTGTVGTVALLLYFAKTLLRPPHSGDARGAMLPLKFGTALLIGGYFLASSNADFGIVTGVLLGTISGL